MRTKKILIIAAVAVMLVVGATAALADYAFEGDAEGRCGDIFPWHPWQGTVYTGTPLNYFQGYWGNDPDNWIYGVVTSITAIDTCYGVSNGVWGYDGDTVGHWSGCFCLAFCPDGGFPRDTAFGEWWSGDTCRDSFWGDFAGD